MRKVMLAAGLVAVCAAQAAQAQTASEKPWQFGPEVNFATQNIGIGVGARAVYNALGTTLKVPGLKAFASFDLYFPGSSFGTSAKFWQINANATYDIKMNGVTGLQPYAGAGLNYSNWSFSVPFLGTVSTNGTGLNLLAGTRFKLGQKLNAFAELRYQTSVSGALNITAGVLF